MRTSLHCTAIAALALVGVAWLSSGAPAASVGVDFSVREAPINARGVMGMRDLAGKPIVIDFWGKN